MPQILHFLLIKRIRKLSYTYKKIYKPEVFELSVFLSLNSRKMWKEKLITNNPFIQILIEGSLENKLPWHTISEKKNTMIKKKKTHFSSYPRRLCSHKTSENSSLHSCFEESSIKVIVRMLRA